MPPTIVTDPIDDRILTVALDNPPVNGLSHAVRVHLCEQLERARTDAGIDAVVIYGTGRCFCAGADIKELGTPAALNSATAIRWAQPASRLPF